MDAKLTQDELQAIKERAEKAAEGPWVEDDGILRAGFEGDEVFDYSCGVNNAHNAEFIAAARQDIPKLVAEVERLHRFIEVAAAYGYDGDSWASLRTLTKAHPSDKPYDYLRDMTDEIIENWEREESRE